MLPKNKHECSRANPTRGHIPAARPIAYPIDAGRFVSVEFGMLPVTQRSELRTEGVFSAG